MNLIVVNIIIEYFYFCIHTIVAVVCCIVFVFCFAKNVSNKYHAEYCMHFIPAEFDQINNLQHFT